MREGANSAISQQTVTPARVHIALDTTPSEAWTVTKGGGAGTSLLTACRFAGACFRVENTSGTEITDGTGGTGDSTIVLRWLLGNGPESLADGAYTGTITVDPATGSNVVIDITLTVVAALPYLSVTYISGYPLAGCTNPDSVFYNYTSQCGIPDEYPPDGDLALPAKGANYTDPRFGGTVTRITQATDNCNHRYSTASSLSIDNTYLMCGRSSGEVDIYRLSDQVKVYAAVPVSNLAKTFWSPLAGEDEVLYFLDGGMVKKRVLNTSTTSTVKDLTGAPWNFTGIDDGGTSKPSSNGYLAFWESGQTEVCALNLATADVYCADYSAIATFSHIDFVEVEYDSSAAKTYVKFIAAPKSPQWEVNTGTGVLDLLGSFDEKAQSASAAIDGDGICETGEDCLGEPHATLIRDAQGLVHMFWAFSEIMGSDKILATAELSKGAGMLRPVEETAGGLRFLQTIGAEGVADQHFGSSMNGAVVMSSYGVTQDLTTKVITAATAANPAVITVAGHGYSNGNVKVIASATGNTCINGVWTLANVTADTFELSGSTCSGAGAYDASTGLVSLGVAAADAPNRQVVWLVVPGTNGYVKPLAQHRMKPYNGGGLDGCCNVTPRASISMDGSVILFASNMGRPELPSLYTISTGYSVHSGPSKTVGGGTTIGGGVTR
jgi:hypothetical protein